MAPPTPPHDPFHAADNSLPNQNDNADNPLSNQNYTGDWAFTGDNGIPSLDWGDNDIILHDDSALPFNGDNGDWAFTGDNSLSIEDYTCNGIPSLEWGDNNIILHDGVNSLPPQGDSDNSLPLHDGVNSLPPQGDSDNSVPLHDGVNSIPPQGDSDNSLPLLPNWAMPSSGDNSYDGARNNIIIRQDWRMSVPLGFKFRPTDEELVINYLLPEFIGIPSAPSAPRGIITHVDIYNYEPRQLSEMAVDLGGGKMYFYTYVKNIGKSKTDRIIKSRAGCWWKKTGSFNPILDRRTGNTLAYKSHLAFYEGKKKTQWLMHEYRLNRASPDPSRELVLAVIYYHRRGRREEGEDEHN